MNRLALLIALGLFLVVSTVTHAAISDPIKIDTGMISGIAGTDPNVRIYRGIPYAAPPLGDLRWRAPQPAAHWDGVRAADKFGSQCMQARGGSEDCLYVNVWTAAATANAALPVMVWSHPGGYTQGSGQSNGEPLAAKGVVLVTYNYRLGPFGFFSHPELSKESGHNASGNQALMDMAEVLRWVKRNISAFGGDPNKVTIVGDSAGASMDAGMVGSPQGKGLFIRAISESGAWMGLGMSAMTPLARAEQSGAQLGTTLGAPTLAELRKKPAADIQAMGRGSGMIIDGYMIPEDLSLTFADGRQNPVDILVGSNKDEGTFFARTTTAAQFASSAKQTWGDLADAYLKLYPASTDAEANASSLATFRDTLGWHQRTYAMLQEKLSNDKKLNLHVFVYYFTHDPTPGPNSRGATHGAEATYVFNTPGRAWTDTDKALGEQISSYWVNFAKSGNPNGQGLPSWPEYHANGSSQPIVLGETSDVQPDAARINLFDKRYAILKGRIGK
jgi:para-nitrobenzyl esterase